MYLHILFTAKTPRVKPFANIYKTPGVYISRLDACSNVAELTYIIEYTFEPSDNVIPLYLVNNIQK